MGTPATLDRSGACAADSRLRKAPKDKWAWNEAPVAVATQQPFNGWTQDASIPGQVSSVVKIDAATPPTESSTPELLAHIVEPLEDGISEPSNVTALTPRGDSNRRPSILRIWPKSTKLAGFGSEGGGWFKNKVGSIGFTQLVRAIEWWQELREPPRTGRLHRLISSQWLDAFTALIIFVNSALTAATADWELKHIGEKPFVAFGFLELSFIAYYTMEFFIKLAVHRQYFFCNSDMGWNWFDLVVLAFSIFDQVAAHYMQGSSSNLSFARSFRIFKIGKILRMFRLVHMLRELRTMMESILGSFVSLFWSFVMLGLILYIFSLMFCQAVISTLNEPSLDVDKREDLLQYFGTVRLTLLTLYMCTTGGIDWHDAYMVVRHLGIVYTTFFLFYITFWTFAVVNILTGIFVDSAMRIAAPDRDAQILQQRRKDAKDSKELRRVLAEALHVDPEQDAVISKELFALTVQNPRIHRHLATLGLEVKDVDLFFDTLVANSGESEMGIDEFVAHAIRMKGLASSIDVQGLAIQMRGIKNQLDTIKRSVAHPHLRPASRHSMPAHL